jgi:hypothetical protein
MSAMGFQVAPLSWLHSTLAEPAVFISALTTPPVAHIWYVSKVTPVGAAVEGAAVVGAVVGAVVVGAVVVGAMVGAMVGAVVGAVVGAAVVGAVVATTPCRVATPCCLRGVLRCVRVHVVAAPCGAHETLSVSPCTVFPPTEQNSPDIVQPAPLSAASTAFAGLPCVVVVQAVRSVEHWLAPPYVEPVVDPPRKQTLSRMGLEATPKFLLPGDMVKVVQPPPVVQNTLAVTVLPTRPPAVQKESLNSKALLPSTAWGAGVL